MGGIKLTKQDIINFLKNKDGTFVKEEIVKNRRIITVKCNKDGNTWSSPLHNLKKGKWCKVCFDNKNNINRDKIINEVALKGYELLTDGPLNRNDRFWIRCPLHELVWETCYGNLKYADGHCRLCSKNYPSINVIRSFVESNGGELVGTIERTDADTRTLMIRCIKHNHTWKTGWNILQRDIWCKKCAEEKRTIKHSDIKKLVEGKGGVLLSENCSSATQKILVKCKKDNYKWVTTWTRIMQGCWCARCSGMEKYTIEKVRNIINKKGGELLTNNIFRVKQNVDIKCDCGNKFTSNLHHIITHSVWCQVCSPRSKEQYKIYEILKQLFPNAEIHYNFRGFDWLKMNKKQKQRMEIDIWVPDLKLAIEYDGIQHFQPVKFSSNQTDAQAKKVFTEVKRRDRKKEKLIGKHENEIEYFIRFNYKDKIEEVSVKDRLIKYGLSL